MKDHARLTPVIDTTCGSVRGYTWEGVHIFKNIRFASAPRWGSPVPAVWEGVRDATHYGYVPPILDHELPRDDFFVPHYFGVENEDCLNLNLWTPTLEPGAKKPVVVTAYGGSFATGSAVEMQDLYSDTLVSLAHTGRPGRGKLADWRPYTARDPATMVFARTYGVMERDDRAFVALMEKHPFKR